MQEILIEIILTFCVGAMTFSVKRGGSEPYQYQRISMEYQNHFKERAKLSRRITIEQKLSNLSASHIRLLLKHFTEDQQQESVKSRRKFKTSPKYWRSKFGDNKTKRTSRFNRFKQFHGASENEMNTESYPV